jgi:hypothetical protein
MIRQRLLISAATAVLMLGAYGARLDAQGTVCKDGSTSTATGKGACSGHGGVDTKATAAAKKAATAQAKAATAAPSLPAAVPATSPARTRSEAKSQAPSAPGVTKPSSNKGEDNDPTGAIAQCKDGMYSHAANRRGACSKHGGVAKWLKS